MDFNVQGKVAELFDTRFGRYLLYREDLVSNTLLNDMFWEEELQPVFDYNLNKESIVIEVGSYVGDHTIYLSKLCKKVYAFEFQRHIFHQLCANLFLNKCGNVYARELPIYDGSKVRLATQDKIDAYAIPRSDAILTDPLEYDFTNNASGIFFKPDKKGNIKTYKLDNIVGLKEKIDMIVVDAEGSDLSILIGATKIISKYNPIIVFEFNENGANIHNQTFDSYKCFFDSLGYNMIQIGNWNWVAKHV